MLHPALVPSTVENREMRQRLAGCSGGHTQTPYGPHTPDAATRGCAEEPLWLGSPWAYPDWLRQDHLSHDISEVFGLNGASYPAL